MNEYDVFKKNLETDDRHGVGSLRINKQAAYRGDLKKIIKPRDEDEIKDGTPLAAAVIGLKNTEAPLPDDPQFYTAWTDIDAQEIYINSKPTCYLILSKPGAGSYSLGEALSKKTNCIHLCPRNILSDEIDQESPTGKCLRLNMRMNKVVTFTSILKILKVKMESATIKHRGYVISGFPLVNTNRNEIYLIESLYGEESVGVVEPLLLDVIYNLKRKPKKKKMEVVSSVTKSSVDDETHAEEEQEQEVEEEQQPEDIIEEEEEEIKVELPQFILDSCSDLIFPQKPYFVAPRKALLEQLNFMFSMEMKPDIIIYLSSPDIDLVTKKYCKLFNNKNANYVTDPFPIKVCDELRWPPKFMSTDYVSPIDNNIFNSKYCCRHPMNFKYNSTQQMCNYKNHVYPFIEPKLNDYDPKYIIRLDGRQTLHEMMHNVLERLILMNLQPVIIPEPLKIEEPSEDLEEFWKSLEEMNNIKDGALTYKRYPSLWFNRCPVELKKGKSVIGKPKLAVSFFKHVYLLSSVNALISFCWNPRPYLRLKYLEPSCRIIVIGTKSSGKTMVSECLSWLFNIKPLTYEKFVEEEKQKKFESFAKTILPEIIPVVEDARLVQWQREEMERKSLLNQWISMIMTQLEQFIPLLIHYITYLSRTDLAAEGLLEEEEVKEEEFDEAVLNKIEQYKRDLAFLPYLDDPKNYVRALDRGLVAQFAPTEYRTPIPRPLIPEVRDQDVIEAVIAHVETNDLKNEIEPTMEELVNELVKVIVHIDNQQQLESNNERCYGRYVIDGFPSDPDFWGILADSKLLPDYVITLIEGREVDQELFDFYKLIDHFPKNHEERFVLVEDPLVKIKLLTNKPSENKEKDVKMIVNNIVKNTLLAVNNEVNNDLELLAAFSGEIAKFKDNIDNVKLKLEENNKCYIDVELEKKTDIEIMEEVLLKLRQGYFIKAEVNEDEEAAKEEEDENTVKDLMKYNDPLKYCETNIYCPIAYYDYGVLWEGKTEFTLKYNNNLHLFSSEECLQLFQKDITKYQSHNKPFKHIPPLRICVIGPVGSGKTVYSKLLAKELGLIHIDLAEVVNEFVLPKHFKKVGRQFENMFTDVSLDEEAVVEFQMSEENENLMSDILSNETEMRRMIYNYFERGSPVLPILMQKLIKKLWFEDPFVNQGIVFDGYPRLPTDVEDMVACFCIPDLVIELESTSEMAVSNLSNLMFKKWKLQMSEAKEKARQKLDIERQEWMNHITKQIVAKMIVNELIEDLFFSYSEPIQGLKVSNESIVAADTPTTISYNADNNLINTYNEMIVGFPEPLDQTEWPKADEVRENINARLESIFDTDYDNIQNLKDNLSEQNIKTLTVDATKPLNKIMRLILLKMSSYRNRSQSLFEQTFIVSPHISKTLLMQGFCFLSKFNRMCPVYIFENPNIIQNNYKISKHKGIISTVLHRCYLYFISGEENVKKFRRDPLKYVIDTNICSFIEYPLKIAVIGPPKSGKSTLAAKLAKRFDLLYVSRGMALRHVLHTMHWTVLANKIELILRSGECVKPKDIMMAVQAMIFDHRTTNNGYVLDGFPRTAAAAMLLARRGTYPTIIFEIKSEIDHIVQNSQREIYYDILKYRPPYSEPFIRNRYKKLDEIHDRFIYWVNNDYLNIYPLNGYDSKWQCLQNVLNFINDYVPQVHHYLNNFNTDAAVPAGVMCISNETFDHKCSEYKKLCPICFHQNTIKHGDCPMDKKGVVQYKNKFYWVCPDHMDLVLRYPDKYLKEAEITIPELPAVVKCVHIDLVHENGICIVTYAENLPSQKIIQGSSNFSASFKGKIYMMCSAKCLEKFLAKPHIFADITVFSELKLLPPISLNNLPDVGYLEQTVGNILVEACCAVNVLRPKYPGLSIAHSALLYIAVYLKAHNPKFDKRVRDRFYKVMNIYEARSVLIKRVGLIMRSVDNPFANYPQCCKHVSVTVVKQPSATVSAKPSVAISN